MAHKGDVERGEHHDLSSQNRAKANNIVHTDPTGKAICNSTSSVYQALQHLLLICDAGGLIFKKNFAVMGIKRHLSATHIYSCILLIFHITNILRWLTMFDGKETFGTFLFLKICYCVWSLECVGHYVASFIACESYRLPKFFTEWEKIRPNCSQSLNVIKSFSIVCAVILSIISLANSAFTTYLIFWTTYADVILTPWNREYKYVVVIQLINVVQCIYLSFAWFGPSVLMFIICKILGCEFKQINSRIKDLSRMEPSSCVEKLEGLRRHHQNLCNLVANADDIFSMQIAISFTGSLVIACLMIQIIIYNDDPTLSGSLIIAIKGFWVCSCLLKVVADCVSAAILSDGVSFRSLRTGSLVMAYLEYMIYECST